MVIGGINLILGVHLAVLASQISEVVSCRSWFSVRMSVSALITLRHRKTSGLYSDVKIISYICIQMFK